jgi:hypothetical protein
MEVKRSELKARHSPPYSTEIKNGAAAPPCLRGIMRDDTCHLYQGYVISVTGPFDRILGSLDRCRR